MRRISLWQARFPVLHFAACPLLALTAFSAPAAGPLPPATDAASREAIQHDWMLQDYARAALSPAAWIRSLVAEEDCVPGVGAEKSAGIELAKK